MIETTGGTGTGQKRVITAYNTATKLAAIYPDWVTAPNATTAYAVRAGKLFVPLSRIVPPFNSSSSNKRADQY